MCWVVILELHQVRSKRENGRERKIVLLDCVAVYPPVEGYSSPAARFASQHIMPDTLSLQSLSCLPNGKITFQSIMYDDNKIALNETEN